jgi:hypothetical protein
MWNVIALFLFLFLLLWTSTSTSTSHQPEQQQEQQRQQRRQRMKQKNKQRVKKQNLVREHMSKSMLVSHPKFLHGELLSADKQLQQRYIVHLHNGLSTTVHDTIQQLIHDNTSSAIYGNPSILQVYEKVFNGFAITNISTKRMVQILDQSVIAYAAPVRLLRCWLLSSLFFSLPLFIYVHVFVLVLSNTLTNHTKHAYTHTVLHKYTKQVVREWSHLNKQMLSFSLSLCLVRVSSPSFSTCLMCFGTYLPFLFVRLKCLYIQLRLRNKQTSFYL